MITTYMLQDAIENNTTIRREIGLREGVVYYKGKEFVVDIYDVDDIIANDRWHNYGSDIEEKDLTRIAGEINTFLNKWKY